MLVVLTRCLAIYHSLKASGVQRQRGEVIQGSESSLINKGERIFKKFLNLEGRKRHKRLAKTFSYVVLVRTK